MGEATKHYVLGSASVFNSYETFSGCDVRIYLGGRRLCEVQGFDIKVDEVKHATGRLNMILFGSLPIKTHENLGDFKAELVNEWGSRIELNAENFTVTEFNLSADIKDITIYISMKFEAANANWSKGE